MLFFHPERNTYAAISPSGEAVAVARPRELAVLGPSAWAKPLYIEPGPVAWSPDGAVLVTAQSDLIAIRDAKTGEPLNILDNHPWPAGALRFLPDGRLLIAYRDGTLAIITENKKRLFLPPALPMPCVFVPRCSISSDGKRLAVALARSQYPFIDRWDYSGNPVLLDIDTGDLIAFSPFSRAGDRLIWTDSNLEALSPDGRIMAFWRKYSSDPLCVQCIDDSKPREINLHIHDPGCPDVLFFVDNHHVGAVVHGQVACLWSLKDDAEMIVGEFPSPPIAVLIVDDQIIAFDSAGQKSTLSLPAAAPAPRVRSYVIPPDQELLARAEALIDYFQILDDETYRTAGLFADGEPKQGLPDRKAEIFETVARFANDIGSRDKASAWSLLSAEQAEKARACTQAVEPAWIDYVLEASALQCARSWTLVAELATGELRERAVQAAIEICRTVAESESLHACFVRLCVGRMYRHFARFAGDDVIERIRWSALAASIADSQEDPMLMDPKRRTRWLMDYAEALHKAGRFEDATKVYEAVSKAATESMPLPLLTAAVLRRRGEVDFIQGRYLSAADQLTRARKIEIDQGYKRTAAEDTVVLAIIAARTQHPDNALDWMIRAVDIVEPDDPIRPYWYENLVRLAQQFDPVELTRRWTGVVGVPPEPSIIESLNAQSRALGPPADLPVLHSSGLIECHICFNNYGGPTRLLQVGNRFLCDQCLKLVESALVKSESDNASRCNFCGVEDGRKLPLDAGYICGDCLDFALASLASKRNYLLRIGCMGCGDSTEQKLCRACAHVILGRPPMLMNKIEMIRSRAFVRLPINDLRDKCDICSTVVANRLRWLVRGTGDIICDLCVDNIASTYLVSGDSFPDGIRTGDPLGLTFRLFVSSTFVDFQAEREALSTCVFPALCALCESFGCTFEPIDLRWGISEAADANRQTMMICLDQIRRCQATNTHPNFLALVGNRYGSCPLPAQIPESTWNHLFSIFPVNIAQQFRKLYLKDENAIPAQFLLQPKSLAIRQDEFPSDLERQLAQALGAAVELLELNEDERISLVGSATDQEIRLGLSASGANDGAVVAILRQINGSAIPDQFYDIDSNGQRDQKLGVNLDALRSRIKDVIGRRAYNLNVQWTDDGYDTGHESVLSAAVGLEAVPAWDAETFCGAVWLAVSDEIQKTVASARSRSPLERELDVHEHFADDYARVFVGRKATSRRLDSYIRARSKDLEPLVVHGPSGIGKSAWMAMASRRIRKIYPDAVVVERFIGATPASTNLRNLLDGILADVQRADGHEIVRVSTLDESVREFTSLLESSDSGRLLTVLIDGVDRLRSVPGMRPLTWLPRKIGSNVRFIISMVDKEFLGRDLAADTIQFEVVRNLYQTYSFIELGQFTMKEAEHLLDTRLAQASRMLQPSQRAILTRGFKEVLNPLYVTLLIQDALHWKSDYVPPPLDGPLCGVQVQANSGEVFSIDIDPPKKKFKSTGGVRVSQVPSRDRNEPTYSYMFLDDSEDDWRHIARIHQHLALRFSDLEDESRHGQILVKSALSLLVASREGLTDNEILDILSLDSNVVSDFKQRSPNSPPFNRFPQIAWFRLRADLEPFLMIRDIHGAQTLTFAHKHIASAVRLRYNETHAATALARYFDEQPTRREQNPNYRKAIELPNAQLKAGFWEDLERTLTDLDFLLLRCEMDDVDELLGYYRAAMEYLGPDRGPLADFANFVTVRGSQLSKKPIHVLQTAYNRISEGPVTDAAANALGQRHEPWLRRLNRTPHERDSGATVVLDVSGTLAAFGADNDALLVAVQNEVVRYDLTTCRPVGRWDAGCGFIHTLCWARQHGSKWVAGGASGKMCLWKTGIDSHSPTGAWRTAEDYCVADSEWHAGGVDSIVMTADGNRIFSTSGSNRIAVWNGQLEQESVLEEHNAGISVLALSENEELLVSGDEAGGLWIWDTAKLKKKHILEGHKANVRGLAFRNDVLVSADMDGEVRIWNPWNGLCRHSWTIDQSVFIYAIIFYRDDRLLFSCAGKLLLCDLATGTVEVDLPIEISVHQRFAVSKDGTRLAVIGSDSVRVWNTDTLISAADSAVESHFVVGWRTDGPFFTATRDREKTTIQWLNEDRPMATLRTTRWFYIAISVDCATAATSYSQDIQIWDMISDRCILALKSKATGASRLAFSPNGQWLVAWQSGSFVELWRIRDFSPAWSSKKNSVSSSVSPRFTGDNAWLVYGVADNKLEARSLQADNSIIGYDHPYKITELIVHPAKNTAVFSDAKGDLFRWELDENQAIRWGNVHPPPKAMAFTDDARYLFTVDTELDLWTCLDEKDSGEFRRLASVRTSLDGYPDVYSHGNQVILASMGRFEHFRFENISMDPPWIVPWRQFIPYSNAFLCPRCGIWSSSSYSTLGTDTRCEQCGQRVQMTSIYIFADWREIADLRQGKRTKKLNLARSNAVVEPADITNELLEALFSEIFESVQLDRDGDVMITGEHKAYVSIGKDGYIIRFWSAYRVKNPKKEAARNRYMQHVNRTLVALRVYSTSKNTIIFDFTLFIGGGVTMHNIAHVAQVYMKILSRALKEDKEDVLV